MRAISGILLCGAIFAFSGGEAEELKREDVVGEWFVTSEGELDDGKIMRSREIVSYREDGSYYSEGAAVIVDAESGSRLMTVSGPDTGEWSLEGQSIKIVVNDAQIDFFSAAIPELSRELIEEGIKESIGKPTLYEFQEKKESVLKLKESEEDTVVQMTPLSKIPVLNEPFTKALKSYSLEELGGDPTVREGVEDDPTGERLRRSSYAVLSTDGFLFAQNLPTFAKRKGLGGTLRPEEEILKRFLCNYVAVSWAIAPEAAYSSESLKEIVEKFDLLKSMTDEEKEVFLTERKVAEAKYSDYVGWNMENMWALAWVLGYEIAPDVDQDQITEGVVGDLWELAREWAEDPTKVKLRPLREVAQMEDLFYCAHNAVRTAQTSNEDAVPKGFHPILLGGVIHEKRHALTWVLSPGVAWKDTDLST